MAENVTNLEVRVVERLVAQRLRRMPLSEFRYRLGHLDNIVLGNAASVMNREAVGLFGQVLFDGLYEQLFAEELHRYRVTMIKRRRGINGY